MSGTNRTLLLAATIALLTPSAAWCLEPLSGNEPTLYQAQYAGPPFADPGFGPDGQPGAGPAFPGQGRAYEGPYGPGQGAGRSSHGSGGFIGYHGFKIDLTEASSQGNVASAVAAVEHQVDIVDSVGLSGANLRLFHQLPIRITGRFGNGGGHYSGGREVQMGAVPTADTRPILLHEYMHAYHALRLSGGFRNPTILRFYEEARAGNLYPPESYMMSNPAEFFAMTASCYLYGTVARPPYNRDAIRTQQPGYYAYLGQLFGRGMAGRASQAAPMQDGRG